MHTPRIVKNNIRVETNVEPTIGKADTEMDDVCDDLKVLKVRNWKGLTKDTKAWNDLSEKTKPYKGL
jgi:hypothetical protein